MKRYYFLALIVGSLSMTSAKAQTAEAWTTTAGYVNWQRVTPLGDFIISTPSALTSLNVDTGEVLWSLSQFGGISESNVTQAGNSPFLSINKDDIFYLIDPFSGEEKFNSTDAGINEITSRDFLYKNNGILILGKSGDQESLLMADIETGKTIWTIEEEFGRIIALEELPNKELLIVTLFNNYRINSSTGEVIWKKSITAEADQIANMGKFGSLLKEVATEQAKNMDINIRFWKHPTRDIFIIGSENEKQSGMTSSSSSVPSISYENVYYAYDMKDGSRIWEKPIKMNGRLGELVFEETTITILPDNGNATKINRFDLSSTDGLWGKKGRGIKIKGGIYSYIDTGNGYLLISRNDKKNYLSFLDSNAGVLTFDKPIKINGEVIRTSFLDNKILVTTTREVNILDISTGILQFPDGISTSPNLITEKDGKLYLYDNREGNIKTINLTDGAITNLSSVGISFEGKENPEYIELRNNGVLLTASQNLALVGFDGKIISQKYFKAPQEPGLIKALRYAQAVRAAYIGAAAYSVSAQFESAAPKVAQEDPVSGAAFQGLGDAYNQMGDAATDFARESLKRANARFKATSNGRDFIIVLAGVDQGNALLKVNKETGEVMGQISLGKETEPIYAVDDVTSQVYLKTNSNTVTSYKF